LSWLTSKNYIPDDSKWSKYGLILFALGILITEIMLFYQGAAAWFVLPMIPDFFKLILWVSGLMPLGILMILWSTIKKSTNSH